MLPSGWNTLNSLENFERVNNHMEKGELADKMCFKFLNSPTVSYIKGNFSSWVTAAQRVFSVLNRRGTRRRDEGGHSGPALSGPGAGTGWARVSGRGHGTGQTVRHLGAVSQPVVRMGNSFPHHLAKVRRVKVNSP